MKILLISANVTLSPYPLYPLGVSIIAAALTKAGHEVRQADFLQQNSSLDAIGSEVQEFVPDLVGISVRNIDNVNLLHEQYYILNVKNIVDTVRKHSGAKVLLGGAGFSLIPQLILEETGADYGIIGEGEVQAVEFANNAAKGIYPRERLIGTQAHLAGTQISSALYDERLLEFYLHSGNIASVQTKRGCTHSCIYCTYPLLEGAKIRRRDPRAVADDIETLRDRFKAKFIFFVDSVFNDDEGAYLDVLDEMVRRKINIPWTGFFKPGGLTDEIVERMKLTGFGAAEVGTDAASDTTLKRMGKSFSFSDVRESSDLFVRHGIATSHFFMFGGPGETEETVREGIENILSLQKCVAFIFMGIRILPNTPLARLAIKENIIKAEDGLLKPVYYLAPGLDKKWLEETLTKAFTGVRHCVFPPDAMDNNLQILHKLGYTGPMWDLLLPGRKPKPRERTRHAAKQP
ncbi:MAG: lipid biosynthesis B12-binding/radical SAM protein [Nitrospirae bacterium GWC2_57_9]|nr:MAG: lipid biosynthesis B12-binding/radical SAM protein [Nitrospirae bacterium GWC2_57_9]